MTDLPMTEIARLRRQTNTSNRAITIMAGMLLAPPLLLAAAWQTTSFRYRHMLLTAFVAIYGATIGIAYDPSGAGADGVRHLLKVYVHYTDLTFDDFIRELWEILTLQVGTSPNKDVYIHVVSYLVGGILGMPGLFFLIVATVYGYFFTGSMLIIFRGWGKARLPIVTLFLILTFFLIKNIEGVNTVRGWTALWVLVYGSLKYHETKNLRYLLLMAMPPFIHIGYFVLALPAYLVLLFGSRIFLYAMLFILSSFMSFINPGTFREVAMATEQGEVAIDGYFVEERSAPTQNFQNLGSRRIWLVFEEVGVHRWAFTILIYTLLWCGVFRVNMNNGERWLASIGLLTLAMSNSLWFMYAVNNRGWIVGTIFLMAAFTIMRLRQADDFRIYKHKAAYHIGLTSSAILLVPYFLYNLSFILDFPSFFLLLSPFVVWLDPSLNLTIKEALRTVIYSII